MKTIRRIFRPAAFLTAATAVLVACSAAAPAFAKIVPPPDGAVAPPPPPPVMHTVTVGGTPGWQIALLMAGTAVLAAAVAVLVERIRTARRAQVTEGAASACLPEGRAEHHELRAMLRGLDEGETHPGARPGGLGELEHPDRAGRPGHDVELEPPGRVKNRDPVVAVDPAAAGTGQNLTVGGSLAVAGPTCARSRAPSSA
jgi:hypothetical protein